MRKKRKQQDSADFYRSAKQALVNHAERKSKQRKTLGRTEDYK